MAPYKIVLIFITSVSVLTICYDIYEWKKSSLNRREADDNWKPSFIFNLWITAVGVSLFLLATSYHVNIFDFARPIEYKNFSAITLKDFKGIKLPGVTLEGENEFAYITTTISIENDFDKLIVKSLFHPSRSYAFYRLTADRLLLEHELYHFHITEYCARKLRKELRGLKSIPTESEINSFQSKTISEINILQEEYDYDTHHGHILKQQKLWKNKIDSLLLLYQEFETTTIQY